MARTRFSLVTMDMQMPGVNGDEATKRAREQVRAKETGIKCGKTNLLRQPHRIAPITLANLFVKGLTMGDAPPKVNGTAPNVNSMYAT